jgi:capsular exopolysaccharide synthesis family protein
MPIGESVPKIQEQAFFKQEFDLAKWVFLLLENRWWIIGITMFTTIVALIYSFLATPLYQATTTVYVQTYARAPIGNQNIVGAGSWTEELKFYNSQEAIIKSRQVMEEVAEKLQLQNHKAFKGVKDPASAFVGFVKVDQIKESSLFNISVKAPYKEDVALWANTVAEVYKDQNLKTALEYVSRANQIIIQNINDMQREYAKLQQAYSNQISESESYFPENQKQIVDEKIRALESRTNELKVKENEVRAIVTQLQNVLSQNGDPLTVVEVAQNPAIQSLHNDLVMAEKELNKLLGKLTPKHPDVIKKQSEIENLNQKIRQQARVLLNSYQNQLNSYIQEEGSLSVEIRQAKVEGVSVVESSSRSTSIEKNLQSIKDYMNLLYAKMQELNISAELLSNNIRILTPALPPSAPVFPNRKFNLLFGLFFGLFISVGGIATIQIFDTRIKSTEDIEQGLGLNLLTMVPAIQAESQRASVEAYQTLRTALIYASQNKQQNVILITSANPKEGKSTVVINTGSVLAAGGDRVLLIDCDLRRPTLHRKFKPEAAVKGLTHYMADKEAKPEDFIVPVGVNLWIMYSGPIPPNPPELFSMKRFKELLSKMKQEFDWVILDSPPALSLTDAQILATYSDLVLLVAKHKETHRPQLQRTIITLERLNAQIAGVVMNYVDTSSSYYYDYYYYSSYYYTTGTSPKKLNWLFGLDLSRFQSLDKKLRRKKSGT